MLKYLRSHVRSRAGYCRHLGFEVDNTIFLFLLITLKKSGETEVTNFALYGIIWQNLNEYIFGFEITMNYILIVHFK